MRFAPPLLAAWLPAFALASSDLSNRPNIVFILTDDQDALMNSMDYMFRTQKYLVNEGTTFARHYCTIAICCPSRVNLWTGQLSHNTNVTDVSPPYGGYPKFISQGYNDKHLAYWMQESGYNTYYSGKLLNAQSIATYNAPFIKGYTGSEFLLDPFTYQYYNATMTRNGEKPVNYLNHYSPDLVAEKAYGFLEDALEEDKPFFLTVAPIAPHAEFILGPKLKAAPPQVAERHKHLFKDYKIPRTKNFNPEKASGVNWVSTLPRLNDTVIEYNDEYQRLRLRALQAVDEMVEKLVQRLDTAGVLDNTYIFYSSDNGYHISQHRMHPGKTCGYESDISVPLVVRGPGVPSGKKQFFVSSHTDLAPTILSLAGVPLKDSFDGKPINLAQEDQSRHEHASVEFWGVAISESKYSTNEYANNTYKSLRIESRRYSLYYSVWCTNEKELYDMKADPGQLHNLLDPANTPHPRGHFLGRHLDRVVDRLDALTMVLKSCKGGSCIYPWRSIHPSGDVETLADALSQRFDAFYQDQPKVSFTQCELGYLKASEGPQDWAVYAALHGASKHEGREGKVQIDPNWDFWAQVKRKRNWNGMTHYECEDSGWIHKWSKPGNSCQHYGMCHHLCSGEPLGRLGTHTLQWHRPS